MESMTNRLLGNPTLSCRCARRLDEQACPDQQNQCESHLTGHQCFLESNSAGHCDSGSLLERRDQRNPTGPQRRREAAHYARRHAGQEGEGYQTLIDSNVHIGVLRQERQQNPRHDGSSGKTEHASAQREEHGLDQQLACDAGPRGAESHACRQLPASLRPPCQEQSGDVQRRQQEQQHGSTHQHPERLLEYAAQNR